MISRRALLAGGIALALAGGCHKAPDRAHTLVVAATAIPHAQILRSVRRGLLKKDVGVEVKVVDDYQTPNDMVLNGTADLNYVQTRGTLAEYNARHGSHLVPIVAVHTEPLAAYSLKWRTLARVPAGASVVVPDEPNTVARALRLLAQANVLTLKPGVAQPGLADIAADPRRLRFHPVPPQDAAGQLDKVDMAFVNTNFALPAKLDPTRDALLIEGKNSPHANYLVGKPGAADDPRVKALVAALTSPATRAFIQKRYKGAVVPAF